MEVTLDDIVDSIENDDPSDLKNLLTHYNNINEYFEIENGVLMTPLLYAIKMKSPDCVDILILNGADPTLSLKVQEKNGDERSLNTNALEYATGEKMNASGEDKLNYEDIILIVKEKLNITEPPITIIEETSDDVVQFPAGSEPSFLSPSQTVNAHRVAQSTIQNQLAIKRLTEENVILKKEIQQLRQEIDRFKPWIERWIYESTPISTPISSIPTIMENDNLKVSSPPPKKVRKKRMPRDGGSNNGQSQVEPLKRASSPKITSPDISRPKSVMVKARSQEANIHLSDKSSVVEKKSIKIDLEKKSTAAEADRPKHRPTKSERATTKSEQELEKKEEIKTPKKTPKKKVLD